MKTYNILYDTADMIGAIHENTVGKLREILVDFFIPEKEEPSNSMNLDELIATLGAEKKYFSTGIGRYIGMLNEEMKQHRIEGGLRNLAEKLETRSNGYGRSDTWNMDIWIVDSLLKHIETFEHKQYETWPWDVGSEKRTDYTSALTNLSLAARGLGVKKPMHENPTAADEKIYSAMNTVYKESWEHIVASLPKHHKVDDSYLKTWSAQANELLINLVENGHTWPGEHSGIVTTVEQWQDILNGAAENLMKYIQNDDVAAAQKGLTTLFTHIDHLWD